MENILEYPIDSGYILKKKKSIKKELLKSNNFIEKKIAILSGSTIGEIKNILEIYLLYNGIKPVFYEGQYNRYYEEVVFDNDKLDKFNPEIIYIHTSNKNIKQYPNINDTETEIDKKLQEEFNRFRTVWEKIYEKYNCVIIQNNFEPLNFRILGNKDSYDIHGNLNFISKLNEKFYDFANTNNNFFINDINYMSSYYGLEKWSDLLYWHMYKYCLNVDAIPFLCKNIGNIIKSLYGKNKKALILDLDNTLWGNVIGDVGVDGIDIGNETPTGQAFLEFQKYLLSLKSIGVMLNVCSKNELNNALEGFKHRDSVLKIDDFISFKANWEDKPVNIMNISKEINILPESMVFIDDNPVERQCVIENINSISVPKINNIEDAIKIIDQSGYFEVTNFSDDDKKRNEFYKANQLREACKEQFMDYTSYLRSLNMKCEIKQFNSMYIERITQLINKTNQFNLTTKRYSKNQIEQIAMDGNCLCIYGRLSDKFGDNGIVTVLIGKMQERVLYIDLWVMSCRVFKRNLEYAIFDYIVKFCQNNNVTKIKGEYLKSNKNSFVKNLYKDLGFKKLKSNENEDSEWEYKVPMEYKIKNNVMRVNEDE